MKLAAWAPIRRDGEFRMTELPPCQISRRRVITRFLTTFLFVGSVFSQALPVSAQPAQTSEPTAAVTYGRSLAQVVATSHEHRQALVALLRGRKDLPDWVRSLITNARYVTGVSRAVKLPEGAFELFGACDPRNCPNSHIRILFSPDGRHVWARLIDPKDGQQILGAPSADQLQALMMPGI